MIKGLPLFPVWAVDVIGSTMMILFSFLSLHYARKVSQKDPKNLIWSYLFVLAAAFSAFSIGRAIGHLAKIALISLGHRAVWESLSPVSGALNTITFIIIASVTFYYRRVEKTFAITRDYAEKMTEAYHKLEESFQKIKDDRDKIIRLERHAIANKMASALAHETRNPISTIGGFVRILKRRITGNPDDVAKLDIILEETQKLEHLVEGILKSGHEIPFEFTENRPQEILQVLLENVREKVRLAKIHVKKDVGSTDARVLADKESIVMALKEIFTNALEASPEDGEITLKVATDDRWAVFSIADQGHGIREEDREKIYEPLFSTKTLAAGLGLSFAKEIIEMHNGYLSFETQVDKGTTFHIYLPLLSSGKTATLGG